MNDPRCSSGEPRSYPTEVVVNLETNQAMDNPSDMSMEDAGNEELVLATHSPPPLGVGADTLLGLMLQGI